MNAFTNIEARADRSAFRHSAMLHGQIRLPGEAATHDLRVRNLSSGGLMAICSLSIARGQPVIVTLRSVGEISGRVVWGDGERIGVAFDASINPRLAFNPIIPQPARRFIPPVVKNDRRPGLRTR